MGKKSSDSKLKLKNLNCLITCGLCSGYLVNATTITECLHTFCRSCLVKYLECDHKCPKCSAVIHPSHPLQYVSFDRTMQDIVYKLVPDLQESERQKELEYYRKLCLPLPSHLAGSDVKKESSEILGANCNYHINDEQAIITLESIDPGVRQFSKKYLGLSVHTTITQLKKFVSLKVFKTAEKFKEIDILCNGEMLGKDHTLKFVQVTRWRGKTTPLIVQYRLHIDF